MVRNYKRKTEDLWSKDDLFKALTCVKNKELNMNVAAKRFGMSRATLYRWYPKFLQADGKFDSKQFRYCGGNAVLTRLEEDILENIIMNLREQYTVTSTDIKRICFEYCKSIGIPNQFKTEKQMASADWYYSFLKRHPNVRLPESAIGETGGEPLSEEPKHGKRNRGTTKRQRKGKITKSGKSGKIKKIGKPVKAIRKKRQAIRSKVGTGEFSVKIKSEKPGQMSNTSEENDAEEVNTEPMEVENEKQEDVKSELQDVSEEENENGGRAIDAEDVIEEDSRDEGTHVVPKEEVGSKEESEDEGRTTVSEEEDVSEDEGTAVFLEEDDVSEDEGTAVFLEEDDVSEDEGTAVFLEEDDVSKDEGTAVFLEEDDVNEEASEDEETAIVPEEEDVSEEDNEDEEKALSAEEDEEDNEETADLVKEGEERVEDIPKVDDDEEFL